MAKPKRKWPRILAMTLVLSVLTGALALVLVDKFAPDQKYLPQSIVKLPSRIVSTLLRPFQGAFAWATNGVSGYLESWKLQKNIEIEYNKLRAQNEEYRYAAMYNEELEAKLERLNKKLGIIEERMDQTPIIASVTGKETGNWFQQFTIDKGKNHDIEQFMAVINEDGLIGYISEVYDTTSDVISIIDSRASVSGLISSSRDQGVVRGTLGFDDEATCRMYYLPTDLVPRPGDSVVTSGIGMPFPKGILIGTIRESTRSMDENKHYVVIEPEVDFQHLEEVIVLIYKPSKEDMPDSSGQQAEYVPAPLDTMRPYPGIGEEILDENLGAVTPPPRPTRTTGETDPAATGTLDPLATPDPNATPTPNPELDELMREEMAEEDNF